MDDIREKIGELRASVKSAHSRVDKIETEVREDLNKVEAQLVELNAHMNKGKGWAAAFFLLAGLAGGGLATLIANIFSNKGG